MVEVYENDFKKIASSVIVHDKIKLSDLLKGNIYSTSEKFTGKYWINEKKIYSKVYKLKSNAISKPLGWQSIDVNLSDINVDTLFFISDKSLFETDGYSMPLTHYESETDYVRLFYNKSGKYIRVRWGDSYDTQNKIITITIEYTKNE